jgi:ABC-type transport system substrate-binding protein
VLTLRGAGGDLAAHLAAPQAAILPGGRPPRATPIGSGPFRVAGLDRGRRQLTLLAHDDHFRGRPYVDRVVLTWFDAGDAEPRQFEDGALHLSARGATVFAGAQPKYRSDVAEAPATLLTYVGFGKAHAAVTADRDFRLAVHLAIARSGLASAGRGERVTPTAHPLPVDLGGDALPAALRSGDLDQAQRAMARAAGRVPALARARRGQLSLEILVDRTRLDDHDVAARVVRALDKLGIAATIADLDAAAFAARVARGDGDLWIGQLAAPGGAPGLVWGAAFAAGGDPWAARQLAAGPLDGAAARREFAARLPILPLMHRSVRLHHRADLRGLAFDASARLGFADVFFFGAPVASRPRGR